MGLPRNNQVNKKNTHHIHSFTSIFQITILNFPFTNLGHLRQKDVQKYKNCSFKDV